MGRETVSLVFFTKRVGQVAVVVVALLRRDRAAPKDKSNGLRSAFADRFAGHEGVAEDIKGSCIALARRSAEGVHGGADHNIDEPDLFEHLLPPCARQATGDSTGPQIDIALRLYGYGSAVGDVGELQDPTGT